MHQWPDVLTAEQGKMQSVLFNSFLLVNKVMQPVILIIMNLDRRDHWYTVYFESVTYQRLLLTT